MAIPEVSLSGLQFETGDRRVAFPAGDSSYSVTPVSLTPSGVMFGPFEVSARAGRRLVMENLAFKTPTSDSLLSQLTSMSPLSTSLAVAGLAASRPEQSAGESAEPKLNRRELLCAGGAALGLLAVSGEARAAEKETINVAEFEITHNPGGARFRLVDYVENVLPQSATYSILRDGDVVDQFGNGENEAIISEEQTGVYEIKASGTLSIVDRVYSAINDDSPVEYTVTLPKTASEYAEGEKIIVFEDALFTGAISDLGGDELTMKIGDTSIPHRNETFSSPAGEYRLRNGHIEYIRGGKAPNSDTVTLTFKPGIVREMRDDAARVGA